MRISSADWFKAGVARQRVGPISLGIAPRACTILSKLLLLLLLLLFAQSLPMPKVYPKWNGPHAGRKGAVAGLACARAARAGRAGRMACAWPRGASLGGGRAGIGRWRWIWIARARTALGEGAGRARRPSAWPGRARGSSVAGVWPQDAGQRWVGLHVHAARGLGGFVCRMQAGEGRPLARAGSDA